MSWSVKITCLYLGFVTIILSLVFTCFRHKTDLEFKDYYAREINFQQQLDAVNNAAELKTPIDHQVEGKTVKFRIPAELMTSGLKCSVLFMRPSDAADDKMLDFVPDQSGLFLVENAGFKKGVYKMQLSIKSGAKSYYKEAVLNFK